MSTFSQIASSPVTADADAADRQPPAIAMAPAAGAAQSANSTAVQLSSTKSSAVALAPEAPHPSSASASAAPAPSSRTKDAIDRGLPHAQGQPWQRPPSASARSTTESRAAKAKLTAAEPTATAI